MFTTPAVLRRLLPALALGACLPASAATVEFINSGDKPAGLPFSEAVRVDDTLYLSGQLGLVPGEMKLAEGGIEAETRQTMHNIQATLQRSGLGFDNVVKCTVLLADIKEWGAFNEVYKTFFKSHFPARSALGTSGLAMGARVEIECIAAFPD